MTTALNRDQLIALMVAEPPVQEAPPGPARGYAEPDAGTRSKSGARSLPERPTSPEQ